MTDRYTRQQTIPNWDQTKLTEASVLIVGSGQIAAAVAAGAAAMGIGEITLLDDSEAGAARGASFLCRSAEDGTPAAQAVGDALRAINPEITVRCVTAAVAGPAQLLGICKPDVMVSASGDRSEALACAETASALRVPLVVAVGDDARGALAVVDNVEGLNQAWPPIRGVRGARPTAASAAVGCVIGGLILGEIRSHLMPLSPRDRVTPYVVRFNSTAEERFSAIRPGDGTAASSGRARNRRRVRSDMRIGLAGAGALGTWYCIGLTDAPLNGARLEVFDPDVVEPHNLNRQILFAGHVGERKAAVLAAYMSGGWGGGSAAAHEKPMAPWWISENAESIDLVVSAVDNFRARAEFSRECTSARVPMINGGSGPAQADVAVYSPGLSACLDCQMQVNRLAATEPEGATSCATVVESSTVIANMITGGVAAAETINVLSRPPSAAQGVTVYDGGAPRRVGMLAARPACECGARG